MLVTDFWVERCLYRKQFEEPQAKVTNTPFPKFPIPGFEALAVCSTGFQGIDLVHMSKTVKLMSATYDEFFTPKASVLLCNAVIPGHEKLVHAQVWGVPAVKAEWLWDCVGRGELIPFDPYLVQPLRDPNQVFKNAESHIPQDKPAKSRKGEKSLEKAVMRSKGQNKKSLPPAEEDGKRLANDTPSSSEQVQVIDPNPWSTTTTGPSLANKKQSPDANTIIDTTLSNNSNLDSESSHTLRPTSGPLHEISPNTSQSKRCTSPEKVPEPSASAAQTMPSPQKPDSTSSSSLGPAISSLLAHHQRASTNQKPPASASSSEQPPHPYRRRRQLLGRAPSNLSSHSINLSRASSVDTMNTDGLGTPLESCNINKSDNTKTYNNNNNNKNNDNSSSNNNTNPPNKNPDPNSIWSAAAATHHYDNNEDPDRDDQQQRSLAMTQLGYEDETVKAWRETVDVKMGVLPVPVGYGKAATAAKGKGTPGKGARARDRDGVGGGGRGEGGGGLGISRRTRLATGAGR